MHIKLFFFPLPKLIILQAQSLCGYKWNIFRWSQLTFEFINSRRKHTARNSHAEIKQTIFNNCKKMNNCNKYDVFEYWVPVQCEHSVYTIFRLWIVDFYAYMVARSVNMDVYKYYSFLCVDCFNKPIANPMYSWLQGISMKNTNVWLIVKYICNIYMRQYSIDPWTLIL